jgi:multidrug efflux pump subunit AcrA (membrane-fusion protein)
MLDQRIVTGHTSASPAREEVPTLIPADQTSVPTSARPRSIGTKVWLVMKTIQARLRFVVILVAIGAVIAYWDTLKAYYERWARPDIHEQAAATDIEYFCPMHPQIVRDRPNEKCPICFMPLSKRKKSDEHAEPLPPGTVSRVQLSPYRVALAGTQTAEITYRQLSKEIVTVGTVEFDERKLARISARLPGRSRIDKLFANVTGQTVNKGDELALLYSPDLVATVQNLLDAKRSANTDLERIARERLRLWGIDNDQIDSILRDGRSTTQTTIRSPISGHVIRKYQIEGEYVEEGARLYDVADLSTVWIQAQVYEQDLPFIREGMPVRAKTAAFPNREFAGRVAFVQPHLDQASRTITARLDIDNPQHELRPGMYATVKLQVSPALLGLLPDSATDKQRHALESGQALAVPESSVIDTGSRKIVYRQSSPGVFEGVEVRLGPRMLDSKGLTYYPVIRGLKEGEQIVTSGSFLIDAETRLNPAAGSIYFGGSGTGKETRPQVAAIRPSTPSEEDEQIKASLANLSAEDRFIAEAQKFCPVLSDNRLGLMGTPHKVFLNGQTVFLCCRGCEKEALAHPAQVVEKLTALKKKSKS